MWLDARLRWLWAGFAGVALAGIIGAAAWVGLIGGDQFVEPACPPSTQNTAGAGCIATIPINDIAIESQSTVGLSPDGGMLFVGGPLRIDHTKTVLSGIAIADGRETWRTSLDGCTGPLVNMAVAAKGEKLAAWGCDQPPSIHVLSVPGGAPIVKIPLDIKAGYITPYYDAAFTEDDSAIVAGLAGNRRIFRLSDPAAEPSSAPGSGQLGQCQSAGFVGQSNVSYVRSRDSQAVIILRGSFTPPPIRTAAFTLSEYLARLLCGTNALAVLSPPDDWPGAVTAFASFSPTDDRLAVIYSDKPSKSEFRTLIEVWDTSARNTKFSGTLERVATFPIRGVVGYRIGWSQDGRRLAAIRQTGNITEARIYAVP
jgi:hypothetical protein